MKRDRKKIISVSLIATMSALFIVGAIVFFTHRADTAYYSVSYDSYHNVENFSDFQKTVKKQAGIDPEDVFIKNGGEIRTDANGNIHDLNLDCTVKQTDQVFDLQIQNREKSEYKLISEKSDRFQEEKILVKDVLRAISCWDFHSDAADAEYRFMIEGELIQNIQANSRIKQYIALENGIEELKSDRNGRFSRVTILCNGAFCELYYQVG